MCILLSFLELEVGLTALNDLFAFGISGYLLLILSSLSPLCLTLGFFELTNLSNFFYLSSLFLTILYFFIEYIMINLFNPSLLAIRLILYTNPILTPILTYRFQQPSLGISPHYISIYFLSHLFELFHVAVY